MWWWGHFVSLCHFTSTLNSIFRSGSVVVVIEMKYYHLIKVSDISSGTAQMIMAANRDPSSQFDLIKAGDPYSIIVEPKGGNYFYTLINSWDWNLQLDLMTYSVVFIDSLFMIHTFNWNTVDSEFWMSSNFPVVLKFFHEMYTFQLVYSQNFGCQG